MKNLLNKLIKGVFVVILIGVVFTFLLASIVKKFSPSPKSPDITSPGAVESTQPSTEQTGNATTSQPTQTVKTTKTTLEKINETGEKYSNFELTIWNKEGDLASEGEEPYEVVLNGLFNKPVASSCDDAKRMSYYMLEALYKDETIRPALSRVLITVPYYLRVSLGASDGVPLAEKNNFSGPTNFWRVMEQMGMGENEVGDMSNRTWGNYLTRCL